MPIARPADAESIGRRVSPAPSSISLREITADTLSAILALDVAPGQHRYVASNAKSIAEAHFEPAAWFRAVYAGNEPVGFAMLYDPTRTPAPETPGICWLWRLMIDKRHQRKGYGAAALRQLIAHVKTLPGISAFRVSYVPGDGDAGAFYRRLAFRDTGTVDDGEIVLELDLAQGR
jgi:diamine N-acetyltransferase